MMKLNEAITETKSTVTSALTLTELDYQPTRANERQDMPTDPNNPFKGWGPSLRALVRSNSYEEYLELMQQSTRELEYELDDDYDID